MARPTGIRAAMKAWKDSASAIVTAKTDGRAGDISSFRSLPGRRLASDFDYNILMLKRHAKSSFLPDSYVFPGGCLHDTDLSDEWLKLFKKAGLTETIKSLKDIGGRRPQIFAQKKGSKVSSELALRICAIREVFEESGLLIVKPMDSTNVGSIARWSDMRKCVKKIGPKQLSEWRMRVHHNDSKFIELCRSLGCVPNVMALSEWANWLTPPTKMKRFDTVFFMCCMDEVPRPGMTPDYKEIVKSEWLNVPKTIDLYQREKIALALPQLYELCRIPNFEKFSDLCKFSSKRGEKGVECQYITGARAKDGYIAILPGDSLYPENPDFVNPTQITLDVTAEESAKKSEFLNRGILRDEVFIDWRCNFEPKYGHVLPVGLPQRIKTLGKIIFRE